MHRSRLGALVIDCRTEVLAGEAEFWGAALGLTPESGAKRINQKYVRLNGHPEEAQVILQRVDHPSRVHLDIETDDIDAEVTRLESLGAQVVERKEKWVIMEAPSKHRFCVIGVVRSDFETHANEWE